MKYFFLFLLIPFCFLSAQADSLFVSDLNEALNVSANFYTSPLRFDSEDWIKFSAIVGLTAISTLADENIKDLSQKNKSNLSTSVFSVDNYYRLDYAIGSMVLLYGYGLIAKDNCTRKLAVKLAEATALASSLTLVSKITIGRARPFLEKDKYYTSSFNSKDDFNSFPSEHTTLAFAYSTVMANEIENVFWKLGWYSLAGLVGYSRIYHNKHWFSDVVMGAAIGYFSGEFVNNQNSNKKAKTKISLYPFPGGLTFQLSFWVL